MVSKYRLYLEGGNGTVQEVQKISLLQLRRTISQVLALHANLGEVSVTLNRILSRLEAWISRCQRPLERSSVLQTRSAASATITL